MPIQYGLTGSYIQTKANGPKRWITWSLRNQFPLQCASLFLHRAHRSHPTHLTLTHLFTFLITSQPNFKPYPRVILSALKAVTVQWGRRGRWVGGAQSSSRAPLRARAQRPRTAAEHQGTGRPLMSDRGVTEYLLHVAERHCDVRWPSRQWRGNFIIKLPGWTRLHVLFTKRQDRNWQVKYNCKQK